MALIPRLRVTVVCILLTVFRGGISQTTVEIPGLGRVLGKAVPFQEDKFIGVDTQIDAFLGIPFAQNPPIRFAEAQPVDPWGGVWNATYFRPACAQLSSEVDEYSEDCLYLNIFVNNPAPSGNAAVMVWIHGGGFSIGTGASYGRYGAPLVAVGEDVIVVTINYRLMVWSVFNTGDEVATGNYGLLDQQLALRWVQTNIAAFGGDPNKVTIFGESAGAASVDFHLLSQGSRDLFSQAIMQSGTSLSPWAFRHDPETDRQEALGLGSCVGCDQTDSQQLVDCLRTVESNVLMEAFWQVYPRSYIRVDGVFLEDTPANLMAAGSFKNVPILAGYNSDEGTIATKDMFPGNEDVAPVMTRSKYDDELPIALYGYTDDLVLKSIDQQYVDWTQADNASADYLWAFAGAVGGQRFQCPADLTIRAHATAGDVVFQYFMTHAPSTSYFQFGPDGTGPGWLGATHTEDIQFVFGWPFIPEWMADRRALLDEEIELSVKVMKMWTNFAKYSHPGKMNMTSDPASSGDFYWPQYTIPDLEYKELSLDLNTDRAVRASDCAFWNQYLPELISYIQSIPPDEEEWRSDFEMWQEDAEQWRAAFDEYQETVNC
ncbi:acetylcholinesterase-like [Diadema setosum]|uniref:acetylcholinesterase-like n=1 Tax=Diadema setosum TaxID=31175 RepID=UPI003B3A2ED2